MIGRRVSHYEIERRLGEGGMGEVWAARDLRLGRRVALKRVRTERADERMRKRLWREARSAASVAHPNVCQVFDVVEDSGELFLAMEFLEGESLAQRLARGAMPPGEALATAREIVRALAAIHDAGLVHRDLKPANVILTAHGAKILDFGLSRPPPGGDPMAETAITRAGQAVGTPRYMAPEQWAGDGIGPPTDLFAAGALLYEMLTGRPALAGSTIREVMEDAVRGRAPALPAVPELAKLDRIIRRALARPIGERYASSHAMLEDLEDVTLRAPARAEAAAGAGADAYTRVVVLPFRLLRPDPQIDFLAFSLPDALVASLSSLDSVVVSPGPAVDDAAAFARETASDAVLTGTILPAGGQVRVTSQLLEARTGRVLRAHTSQGALDDIFRLQDDLARDIVETLPVDAGDPARAGVARRRPNSGRAYELYLRANQLASQRRTLPEACGLYRECLALDPGWAPAWAKLGRAHRVMAKYSQGGDANVNFERAQEAFRHALDLDPDLSVAHNLYTFLEVEELGRSRDAMVRLLERAKKRANDPQLFAGLVLTCRFCGLLDASLAADRRARHLDPSVRTSVHYTYQLRGDWEKAIEYDDEDMKYATRLSLYALGRPESSVPGVAEVDPAAMPGLERHVVAAGRAARDGDRARCVAECRALLSSTFRDPEGRFYLVRNLAKVGETDLAVSVLHEVVGHGFHPRVIVDVDPWLAPLAGHTGMPAVLRAMDAGIGAARSAYEAAGGPSLLGAA